MCSTDVKREEGTVYKEHLFSTSESATEKQDEIAAIVASSVIHLLGNVCFLF